MLGAWVQSIDLGHMNQNEKLKILFWWISMESKQAIKIIVIVHLLISNFIAVDGLSRNFYEYFARSDSNSVGSKFALE